MVIYYTRDHKQAFTKIAKYPLGKIRHDTTGRDCTWTVDILHNKEIVAKHKAYDVPVKLKIPEYIQTVLIGLIRDSNVSKAFKIRVYSEPEPKTKSRFDTVLWCKFYMNKYYIRHICINYGLAPDILSMVIRKNGDNIITETKPLYDNTDIPIFRNESRVWGLPYEKHFNISPYDYQHNNIHWLKGAEDAITKKERYLEYIEVADLIHLKTDKFNYYLDPVTSILYDYDSIWNCDFRCRKFHINGGVLCDEVGLGKTLSMTGLILSDKYGSEPVPKSLIAKLRINPKPIPLPTQDPKPVPEGKTKVVVKAKIRPKIKAVPTSPPATPSTMASTTISSASKEFKCKTTLVLCPRRLVNQWITEIKKYTSSLSVIEMSTLAHVKKYSYSDLDQIDVVVASFSLFDNKNYINQDTFQLNEVKWRRVIVDEGHEVLLHKPKKRAADLRVSTGIFSIKSDFRWICTGTPLPETQASLQAILSYLNNLHHNQLSSLLENITHEDYKRLMEMVFHCNTRDSIKEQIIIPVHHETVDFLNFTKTERAIYDSIDSGDTTRKLQVCTNLSVSETDNEIIGGNILNLTQVTKAMGAYYMQNCDRIETRLQSYKDKIDDITEDRDEKIATLEEELEDAKLNKDKDMMSEIREEMGRIKSSAKNRTKTLTEHISKCQHDLVECRKQLQTFRSLDLEHISNSTCPVLGTKLDGKVAITSEGYYYSAKGIELLFLGGRKVAKCACTRREIQLDSLTWVDTNTKSEEESEDVDVERSKWGTKMSHIINKLRKLFVDDPEAKVIIFSQWKKMLLLMAKALKDCNINHVFCRGNVHMMSKSINSFKTDPKTRVILLSSDSCNSGSNLTEASYVYLIDAVSGDIAHAKAAETQAIARTCRIGQTKEVQVCRFVIKDSVEEIYYRKMTESVNSYPYPQSSLMMSIAKQL